MGYNGNIATRLAIDNLLFKKYFLGSSQMGASLWSCYFRLSSCRYLSFTLLSRHQTVVRQLPVWSTQAIEITKLLFFMQPIRLKALSVLFLFSLLARYQFLAEVTLQIGYFWDKSLKCGFCKKSFIMNVPLVSWAYLSSLLGGYNSKPTQKWWQICSTD